MSNNKFRLILALSAIGFLFPFACGDLEEDECDPATDGAACVCTTSEGVACQDGTDEDCTCTLTSNGTASSNTTASNTTASNTSTSNTTVTPTEYSFVLVQDSSTPGGTGESPGADIDAIGLTADGVETYATAIDDFSIGGGTNIDTTQALDAPDSGCMATNFVSLDGGYLMVSFGKTFGTNDSITVYELGPTTCPGQAMWIDEDYRVSISVSNNLTDFVEIGSGGSGINTVPVP
ncbi:MAG: hypothetical protein AAFX99_17905 [Myxococcota bacterium]